jgi:hypothetical protein
MPRCPRPERGVFVAVASERSLLLGLSGTIGQAKGLKSGGAMMVPQRLDLA